MKKHTIRRVRGFTLMEMLVVISIITVLSAIATPNFITALRNYRLRAATMQANINPSCPAVGRAGRAAR